MRKSLILTSAGIMSVALLMGACSDDNDGPDGSDNKPGTENSGAPSVDNVFSQGLPVSMDGTTFSVNEKGQVTKIEDGSEVITFEYGTFTRAEEFNALMKIRDKDYPDDGSDIYLKLNDKGFATYALQVYLDEEGETDTWQFTYNSDGQLTRLQRSESEDDFNITYANGDITKVVQQDGEGDIVEYTFAYTNNEFKTAVPNKANLMLFDDFFCIDMDEMSAAYFAGMLGKSTKNLPMGYTEKGLVGVNYNGTETFRWVFNDSQLPLKFWEDGESEEYAITWTWK